MLRKRNTAATPKNSEENEENHQNGLASKDNPTEGADTEIPQKDGKKKKSTTKGKVYIQEASYKTWCITFAILSFLAMRTRLYNIHIPSLVCWDEAHFGKFATYYINRTFFFDVHPPIGKMLLALAGKATGYTGNFDFMTTGLQYTEGEQFIGMRQVCAVLGAMLVPTTYITVWTWTRSLPASTFAALLILCDEGTLTLSRFILLDPILLVFIAISCLAHARFRHYRDRPFSVPWWISLAATGVALTGAIGTKFVGLFIVLLIGGSTAWDLWLLLGDVKIPWRVLSSHVAARVLCLIALPISLYLIGFWTHLAILSHTGPGDGFFGSAFQATLKGNSLHNASTPTCVAYGSKVTVKSTRVAGGYLHSHHHIYPEGVGVQQQQVTAYAHKDPNNAWQLHPLDSLADQNDTSYTTLRHGDTVRLLHVSTQRFLHSHPVPAPVTSRHYQVTGYGENASGSDPHDHWRVEMTSDARDEVQPINGFFKLVHVVTGCYLNSHGKKLPPWGFEQEEVTCSGKLDKQAGTDWSVEEVSDERLLTKKMQEHAPGFLSKLLHSHAVMFTGNSGLKPPPELDSSRPWQWPLMYRGQGFAGGDHRIYLLGNPAVFWLSSACLPLFLLSALALSLVRKRNWITPETAAEQESLVSCGLWCVCGWLLHYLPFWPMTRILYFHHYFPALLFACMVTGVTVELLARGLCCLVRPRFRSRLYLACHGFLAFVVIFLFVLFSPLTFGMSGPPSSVPGSPWRVIRWLNSWEI